MSSWQRTVYTPEYSKQFQLVYFEVAEQFVCHDALHGNVADIVKSFLGEDAGRFEPKPGHNLVPVHPLQAEALLLDPNMGKEMAGGRLRCLGAAGHRFSATSSVRTLYSEATPWMPKFSLPVRITNSKRVNRRHELDAAIAIARLWETAELNMASPRLRFMHESAYVTVDLPGLVETGFELLLRDGSLVRAAEDRIVTVSALTSEPLRGEASLLLAEVSALAERSSLSLEDAAHVWFDGYLECVLNPIIEFYDRYGIGFEAHQQNSLLDLTDGVPKSMIYRDSQGVYISETMRDHWRSITPELGKTHDLFYDDRKICERLSYYLVVNQIFAVIARAGRDKLATEIELLAVLRARLTDMLSFVGKRGQMLVDGLLHQHTLPAKANLKIQLEGIDEIADGKAIFVQIPNPIRHAALGVVQSEARHALAS